MANASMKWNEHVQNILVGVQNDVTMVQKAEEKEEIAERDDEDDIDMP